MVCYSPLGGWSGTPWETGGGAEAGAGVEEHTWGGGERCEGGKHFYQDPVVWARPRKYLNMLWDSGVLKDSGTFMNVQGLGTIAHCLKLYKEI